MCDRTCGNRCWHTKSVCAHDRDQNTLDADERNQNTLYADERNRMSSFRYI